MARGLQKEFKKGYDIEDLMGIEYSGQAAVFEMWDGTVQTIFMISDDDGIWNGQFGGSRTMWEKAKKVLGTLARPAR
jgi:hypothetical protein